MKNKMSEQKLLSKIQNFIETKNKQGFYKFLDEKLYFF